VGNDRQFERVRTTEKVNNWCRAWSRRCATLGGGLAVIVAQHWPATCGGVRA